MGVRFQIMRGYDQKSAKEFGLDQESNEELLVALETRSGMMKEVFPDKEYECGIQVK